MSCVVSLELRLFFTAAVVVAVAALLVQETEAGAVIGPASCFVAPPEVLFMYVPCPFELGGIFGTDGTATMPASQVSCIVVCCL